MNAMTMVLELWFQHLFKIASSISTCPKLIQDSASLSQWISFSQILQAYPVLLTCLNAYSSLIHKFTWKSAHSRGLNTEDINTRLAPLDQDLLLLVLAALLTLATAAAFGLLGGFFDGG